MSNKTKRTPEQLAAHYQAKANAARAKAAKQARADETRAKIVLGAAVVKATLGDFKWADHRHLEGLEYFFKRHTTERDWAAFKAWWRSKGYPES